MSTEATSSNAASGSQVFAREATGLVRLGTPWRMFAFNLAYWGFTWSLIGLAFTPAFFPGANLELGVLIVGIGMICYILMYAYFSAIMPRSGGDYVVMSRVLHPVIGFALNFQWALLLMFYVAWGAYWFVSQGLSSFFTVLGSIANNPGLMEFGSRLAQRELTFVVGVILIIAVHALIYTGMRNYYRFQNVMIIIGLIGLFISIALLLFAGNQTFVSNFNAYLQRASGVENGYQTVISMAEDAGLPAQPKFSFVDTLGIIAILMIPTLGSNWIAGEIKDVKRTQIVAMVGSVVFGVFVYFLITLGIRFTVGNHFNAASNYLSLFASDQNPIPVATHANTYAYLLVKNLVLLVIMAISWFYWAIAFLPCNVIVISRMMFAWAFDRIMPDGLARVDERYHSPNVSILVSLVVSILFLVLYAYSGFFLALVPMFAIGIYRAITGLTGLLLPYMKNSKPIYEASGAKEKILGIPVVSFVGAITLVYFAAVMVYVIVFPDLGAGTFGGFLFAAAPWIIAVIIYYVAKAYRKRQGIDIELAFKQIPPE